ncbi:MAG TPA: guanylate kinase [Actinomycetota bacterium]|nr:guanylate kinase [Actinomycetota bacterium]
MISGPSGVGKGTVVRKLLSSRPALAFSVSSTTREPRPGEEDGVHYRFVSVEEFERLVGQGAFLEWAEVFGERYGTPLAEVNRARAGGRHVLLEVDVQGARRAKERVPDAVLIFLRPPSEEELARRLRRRGTEAGRELEWRLEEARREMAEAGWFDHVVVNDDVDRAVAEVLAIIEGTSSEGDPT